MGAAASSALHAHLYPFVSLQSDSGNFGAGMGRSSLGMPLSGALLFPVGPKGDGAVALRCAAVCGDAFLGSCLDNAGCAGSIAAFGGGSAGKGCSLSQGGVLLLVLLERRKMM